MFYSFRNVNFQENDHFFFLKKKNTSFKYIQVFKNSNSFDFGFIYNNFFNKKSIYTFLPKFNLDYLLFSFIFIIFFVFIKKFLFFKNIKNVKLFKFLNIQDSFFLFYFFILLFSTVFLNNILDGFNFSIIFFLVFICFSVFLTPIMYLISFKLSILCIVNSTKKKNKIELVWSDFIAIVSFFLRFFVQLIRILLILVVNFLLMEYLESFSLNFNFFKTTLFSNITLGFFDIIIFYLRLFLENVDFFFILFIQFSAYVLVLFWLLSFLLLTNVFSFFEK